jgi:methanol metabolism-related c-type cytochrome
MFRHRIAVPLAVVAAGLMLSSSLSTAQQGPGAPEAVTTEENGKSYDAAGNPTFKIEPDGTVDWFIYSGYRRYHADCHVCHGPDGEGSSYAPGLVDSVNRIDYATFMEVVASGRQNVGAGKQNVMPAFGTNLNVMCYLDDIYIYLRARAQGELPRGRPAKKVDKPPMAAEEENACMGR